MESEAAILRTPLGLFVLRHDECLSRWVEREGRLDLQRNLVEINSIAHLIPEKGVVIDAGACIGDHTITYSQIVGGEGVVLAFEPHPISYEALVLNTERLRNVLTFRLGLSDTTQGINLKMENNIGGSFMTPDESLQEGSVHVVVTTLDEKVKDSIERCDFIHLDAEGFEPRILRGGRQLIEKFRPALLIEVCDSHLRRAGSSEDELLQLLDEMGYDVQTIPPHGAAKLRDVICVPK